MKFSEIKEDGRIVKGVNTTVDVGTDGIKKQAAKFGNTVDKDGRPPTLSKKVKGSSTNVLFNMGLAESLNLAEAVGEIASATEIYVDMDGVLADFFGEWAKLMDVDHFSDINKQHDINDALQKIRDTDDFWLKLPILPEAKNLLNLIKKVRGEYSICTSPLADDPNSEKHKRTWVEKNLAFFPPKEVHVTHNKPQFATAKDGTPNILIDDYGVNINAWEAAGGIGFKYKDHKFERTAKDIKQHMDVNEGYKLKLERDEEIDVLHIIDTKTKKRIEVRGKKGYETNGYDPQDKLHQVLDKVGRSANVAELMNGNVVSINPKHPQGADAEKTAKDVLTTEAKSADLYHSTHDDESFVGILKSGAIKPNFDHEHTTEKDPRPYISLSRDKKFDMFGSLPITLVIDQTKLANSHKIVPYDSFASDDDFEKRSSGSSEAEERVYKSIPISYIKYVILRNANWVDSEAVLAAAKAANIPVVDLNGQPIKENFADGRKPGRKGIAKRVGVNTKASVSDLRKTAKNSSGEKQRIAHWMANMKSGKNK